jgi:hypothetical protein
MSLLAEIRLASQEGLCSMELVEDETKSKSGLKPTSLLKMVVIIVDGTFGRGRIVG